MNDGWIKIHRKFREWEWYRDSKMVHLFIHLITTANHKPGKWKGIEVNRGQLITGRKKLSEETGISERSIRTCFDRLTKTGETTSRTTNKYTLITICNYENYQLDKLQSDQQTAIKRPSNDHN